MGDVRSELRAALDRLIEHDYVRLVRAVVLFSGTVDGAEDAVQEALARALEQARKGRHIDCLEAWVLTTAFNHIRSRYRRAARRGERDDGPAVSDAPSGPDAEALSAERLDLRAAVRSLPARQREVVVMHYYLDQPISSIGDALGIEESAVKNALHKARGSLLAALSVEQLAVLGLDHAELPIPDGRAPTPAQIRRFLDLVATADGRVFAHCGGGVGRSTSIAATYEAAQGQDPSVLEQLATGPPTIEQIWFVATLRPNHPDHGISPAVAVASVWSTRHAGCTAGSSQSSDAPLQAHQGEEQGRGDYTLEVVALAGVRRGRGPHFYQRLG